VGLPTVHCTPLSLGGFWVDFGRGIDSEGRVKDDSARLALVNDPNMAIDTIAAL